MMAAELILHFLDGMPNAPEIGEIILCSWFRAEIGRRWTKIPDEVLKTIGFVGYQQQRPFLSRRFIFLHRAGCRGGISRNVYAVTARHVIDCLRAKGVTQAATRGHCDSAGSL
jgi:hypothetical protein